MLPEHSCLQCASVQGFNLKIQAALAKDNSSSTKPALTNDKKSKHACRTSIWWQWSWWERHSSSSLLSSLLHRMGIGCLTIGMKSYRIAITRLTSGILRFWIPFRFNLNWMSDDWRLSLLSLLLVWQVEFWWFWIPYIGYIESIWIGCLTTDDYYCSSEKWNFEDGFGYLTNLSLTSDDWRLLLLVWQVEFWGWFWIPYNLAQFR